MPVVKSIVLATAIAAVGVNAYTGDLQDMPNGGDLGYQADFMVCSLGHAPTCQTGTRTAFADAKDAAGGDWRVFCTQDTDNDGQSNGQELGDPCCIWRRGDKPLAVTGLSDPSDGGDTNNIQVPGACPPYPIDCEYEYTKYSECTVTCDGGTQTRTATISQTENVTGRPCGDPVRLERSCNSRKCKVDVPVDDDTPDDTPVDDDGTPVDDTTVDDPNNTGIIITKGDDVAKPPVDNTVTVKATATRDDSNDKNSSQNANRFGSNSAASNIVPSVMAVVAVVAALMF